MDTKDKEHSTYLFWGYKAKRKLLHVIFRLNTQRFEHSVQSQQHSLVRFQHLEQLIKLTLDQEVLDSQTSDEVMAPCLQACMAYAFFAQQGKSTSQCLRCQMTGV